jgi:density-regulated protein DRP1
MVECGLPPEYCEWSARGNDLDDCKKWLAEEHPTLFASLYVVITAEGEEESKEGAPKKIKKKGKKVAFADKGDMKIRVIKLKRGGKKVVSSIVGLEAYGCDLVAVA